MCDLKCVGYDKHEKKQNEMVIFHQKHECKQESKQSHTMRT